MSATPALLLRLVAGETIPASQFSARTRKELDELFGNRALVETRVPGGRKIEVRDMRNLQAWIRFRYPLGLQDQTTLPGSHIEGLASRRDSKISKGLGFGFAAARVFAGPAGMVEITRQGHAVTWIMDGSNPPIPPNGPLAFVEGPVLWRALGSEYPTEAGTVAAVLCNGRISNQLLQLAAEWAQRAPVWMYPDYDYCGLADFARLLDATNARAQLHAPLDLAERLQDFGQRRLLLDQANYRSSAHLATATSSQAWRVIDHLESTGMGLEQEALLLDLPERATSLKASQST